MIQINKPADPFTKYMRKKADDQTEDDCVAFDVNPVGYSTPGEHRLMVTVKKSIYRASGRTKTALIGVIYNGEKKEVGKCYFCESRLPEGGLHIEHYRPKNGFKQLLGSEEEYPGYYWLTYSWDNLILACYECNIIKGTIFPLADEDMRVHSHIERDILHQEEPLLINPAKLDVNPREHICFLDDLPISETPEGIATIKLLKLDYGEESKERPFLKEERLELLNSLRIRVDVLNKSDDYVDNEESQKFLAKTREYLEKAKLPESKFSSMAQDFLAKLGY